MIRVVSYQGSMSSRWSLIRVASHEDGMSAGLSLWSGWYVIRVVSHQGGLIRVPLCSYLLRGKAGNLCSGCLMRGLGLLWPRTGSILALTAADFTYVIDKMHAILGGKI